jgi:hypothetical protein
MEQQSAMLRLPRELRDEIYHYVFDDLNLERVDFHRRHNILQRDVTRPSRALHPLCNTSQQLYIEATPVLFSRVTPISHNVATTCWLRNWLATFPAETGYRAIKQFAFRNFHGPEQIKGYDFVALCPNLRYLSVMLGDEYSSPGNIPSLAITSLSTSANAYDSLDNIILMHQLHKLVEIPRLEVLEFGFHDWEQPISCDRARQVKEWLGVKFRARGRDVNVVCKQMQWGALHPDDDLDDLSARWYPVNEV